MRPSRREFVKWVTASGIALSLSRLGSAEEAHSTRARRCRDGRAGIRPPPASAASTASPRSPAPSSTPPIFAPPICRAGRRRPRTPCSIRAPDATHVYTGIDLARLSGALQAVGGGDRGRSRASIGTRVPEFYAGDLFCPVGKTPLYLGQPVALLIFETFDAFDQARLALRDGTFVKFGEETGPVVMPNYGAYRFTRVAGPDARRARRLFAGPGRLGQSGRFQNTGRAGLGAARRSRTGAPYAKAATYGEQIRAELAANNPACWCWTANSRPNPSIRCFSSRKAGSPGTTPAARTSSSCSACSRPTRPRSRSRSCSARRARLQAGAHQRPVRLYGRRIRRTRPHAVPALCRAGGDVLSRPSGPARARPLSAVPGRASSGMRSRCARASASIARPARSSAFAADHVLDGGGLANFSASVATVGATAAIGIYDIPKVDVTTVALHSRGVTAGSMRGYGTLQTMTALEVLIDEAAAALPLDPIEFRRRNALKTGGRTMTGNPYSVSVRTPEILDKLEKHPIWQQRAEEKARGQQSGIARRHRRRLRHQGLRHRRGLFARHGGDRSGGPHRHPLRSRRDGQRHRDGARQPGGGPSGRRRRRSHGCATSTPSTRSRSSPPATPTRWTRRRRTPRQRNPRWVPAISTATSRLDRRACRHACGGRGGARHLPLRTVAGGARAVGHRADRSEGQAMGGGALERRAARSCRACRRCRCRRSPPRRMRATS